MKRRSLRRRAGLAPLLALGLSAALLPYGCSAANDGSGGNGGGASSGGTISGTGGSGGNGGLGGIGVGQGGSGGADTCAGETFVAEPAPLDLFVLLDQSLSMADGGKWDAVVSALSSFIGDPASSGVGMGLGYFPLPTTHPPPTTCDGSNPNDPACGIYGPCLGSGFCFGGYYNDSCNPDDYAPEITIATLPGVGTAITGSMAAHSPPSGDTTPTQPAIVSALSYARGWAGANPTHVTVVVLATDGLPTNCSDNNIPGIAAAASDAYASSAPVKTFVVGVGGQLSSLDLVADAGGTSEAFIVDTNSDVTQQFVAAMNQVRSAAQCSVGIPTPTMGSPDYGKVNVELADPSGSEPSLSVGYVGTAEDCHPEDGGWYYDDPENPNRIFLCPASCADVTAVSWSVDVKLGCETIVL